MNNKIILDASALLALIQNEKGAEVVRPLIKFSVMSTVNITEVMTVLQRADINPKESRSSISEIIKSILPFELKDAQYAAELQPYVQHKGLSLGDRACLALGLKLNLPIYTADKIWGDLQIEGVTIHLIR